MTGDRRSIDRGAPDRRSPERISLGDPGNYLEELGGRECLERVHKIFYDKLFAHPWLGKFFEGKKRWVLEEQQTEFLMGVFGGPKIYGGRGPLEAHQHMFITEEIFGIRHEILQQSLSQAKVPEDLHERWLRTDLGMRRAIVKESPDKCKGRYNNEAIMVIPNPEA